jgi:uncharacterized integral membrane protein
MGTFRARSRCVKNYTTTSGKFVVVTVIIIIIIITIIFIVISFITTVTFPPLTSVMSQDLALQQGVQQLQRACAEL